MADNNGGWSEWSRYVLNRIEDLTVKVDSLEKSISDIQMEFVVKIFEMKEEYRKNLEEVFKILTSLQIKAGYIGAFFGFLGSAILSIVVIVFKELFVNLIKK